MGLHLDLRRFVGDTIHKFGRNNDVDTGGYETVWNGGGFYTGFDPTAAEVVEVFSASASDTGAGTGAQTIEVFGLDANWEEANETLTLNGVTPVSTSGSYIRMDRMTIRSVGSGGSNAGEITARQSVTTANVMCVMPAGYNQTMIAAWTVPAGKIAYVTGWFLSLGSGVNAIVDGRLTARPSGECFQVREHLNVRSGGSSSIYRPFAFPKGPFPAQTDIHVEAQTDTNNTEVLTAFDVVYTGAGSQWW